MHTNFLRWARRAAYLMCAVLIASTAVMTWRTTPARAANFSMQSGYYVGTGAASRAITGVGFQPSLVLIKASTTGGVMVFKSSAMPANATAFMSATADNTATSIALNSDGFTLGTLANVNSANVVYYWTAFSGSDCSSTGNFCVGTFTGNGAASRTITTGFQPSVVIAKRSTAVAANFRTASMATGRTEFFTSTAADTAGTYINSMGATGFDVGSNNNVNAGVYYYIAFKSGSSAVAEGSYTGNGTDNRNITGVGFQPDMMVIKNSTSATVNNRRALWLNEPMYGDNAGYVGDAVAQSVNMIQAFQTDGFQLGSGVNANENTFAHYWFAFNGTPGLPSANTSFTMKVGTYTGTGSSQSITGVGFAPDLVLIKDNAANFAVFRTSMMAGDITAYLASATADFAGGITALGSDGFTVGTSTIVNTTGNTYQWQAFGSAYRPDKMSGAADFAVGVYYGNGITARNINSLPYQPDLVAVKRNSTSSGVFRTSAYSGDLTGSFNATADTAGMISGLQSNGFTVGTNAATNTSASLHRWFAFREGPNFDVGNYTGTGVDNTVIDVGRGPDLVWVKRTTALSAYQRPSTLSGDTSQLFLNSANPTGRLKDFTASGFTLGTQTEVNASAQTHRYAVWRVPPSGVLSIDVVDSGGSSVASPAFGLNSLTFPYDCTESTGTLGESSQRIRVSNMTGTATWTASIAATSGASALWANGGNTQQFDFNDTSGSPAGCSDGADGDSLAGMLRIEPSGATLTPQSGCSNTNVNLGSNQNFEQGAVDSITLISASSGANTECYWDLTNVTLRQEIPNAQSPDNYTLNLTVTVVAS